MVKPAPGANARRHDLTRASVEAQSRILKAGLDAQLADLDRAQAQNLISLTATTTPQRARSRRRRSMPRSRRQQAALAEAQKDAAGGGNDQAMQAAKEKQIGIEAELTILRKQRARVAITSAADESARPRSSSPTELEQVRIRLLEAQGKSAEARTLAIQHEFEGLSKRLEIEGDTAGQAIVAKLINVEAAKAQLDALQQQVDRALSRLTNTRAGHPGAADRRCADRAAGAGADRGGAQGSRRRLEATIPKAETLAAAIGNPEALAGVEQMKDQLRKSAL